MRTKKRKMCTYNYEGFVPFKLAYCFSFWGPGFPPPKPPAGICPWTPFAFAQPSIAGDATIQQLHYCYWRETSHWTVVSEWKVCTVAKSLLKMFFERNMKFWWADTDQKSLRDVLLLYAVWRAVCHLKFENWLRHQTAIYKERQSACSWRKFPIAR